MLLPFALTDSLRAIQLLPRRLSGAHDNLHARRNFIDVNENFPEESRQVIESLREIYRFEAQAKERKLSPLERLAFHQEKSKPVMDRLRQWMQAQMDQKKIEPNSGLGEAIRYMLKRWETLTCFLSVPGVQSA